MNKFSFLLLSVFLLLSCSQREIGGHLDYSITKTDAPVVGLLSTDSKAEIVELTLAKDAILNRSFLYGASLQLSSLSDAELAVSYAALNLGMSVAYFTISGNKLRLMEDTSVIIESDINHPARLIHEFTILKNNKDSIRIRADKSSPALTLGWFSPDAKETQATWIRSFEAVKEMELLMIESSVQSTNGSAANFLEFIVPREKMIAESDSPIFADPSLNPLADRYRFLTAGAIFYDHPTEGRIKTAVANRFKRSDSPIRWWATRNTPSEFMFEIKAGVEAWNRYSQALWGKDLVKFEGYLPEGVKLGDPRFNIILWDEVADSGAAYESQNADPLTGIQANSMIYLPAAWVRFGAEYWIKYGLADNAKSELLESDLKKRNFLGKKLPVNCLNDIAQKVSPLTIQDPLSFGRELLKGVLFHEMGHSLGLAHNFKGSLSHDHTDKTSMFTTSIMDYNQFNEESSAYDSLESITGPLLEYDRQMIAVLYNNGEGIKESDPVVPACDDAEADDYQGGVDPLCVRYDIGKFPTKRVLTGIDLLVNEKALAGRMSSLPTALENALLLLPDYKKVTTPEELKSVVGKIANGIEALLSVYLSSTANSIGNLGSNLVRNLYVNKFDMIGNEYNENSLREEATIALNWILNSRALPQETSNALLGTMEKLKVWAEGTTVSTKTFNDELEQRFILMIMRANIQLLSKMRIRVLKELKYRSETPFFLNVVNGQVNDMEVFAVEHLFKIATDRSLPLDERLTAIISLSTFKGTEFGYKAIVATKAIFADEIRHAKDGATRDALRKISSKL